MSYPTWEPNYASKITWEIAYDDLQVHGPYGTLETHPTNRMRVIVEGERALVTELLGRNFPQRTKRLEKRIRKETTAE